ncbi:hypothetical protein K8W59_17540 [Nocardioides rotundus]|uniref:S-4TM family putative pore-forming effector n=1 Tax=Nocardioides rotundus TaxID=1774216 RepID=UPI001CC0AE79|nr:S-4TM family putative pore-forming effector [Nocardioides rotundus]UAL29531.1 hypothetical protein K8W59_17540 [Nocardioides rotundus]
MTTTPPIFESQNTADRRRLVRAFARLYSDAKLVFAGRVLVVFLLAVATVVVSLANPDLRTAVGGVGGVALLVASFVVGGVEKWLRMRAAATQEKFDTEIFGLPWSSMHADRPPQIVIARAAERYKGSRDANWYGDTRKAHRPYDVLICQSSNFGWGATMHRIWGWILVAGALLLAALIGVAALVANLSPGDTFVALVVPSLAPFKEIGEQVKANFEAARTKESVEAKVNELWSKGMDGSREPTEADLRAVQDKVLLLRQSNPYVPDWLDNALHRKNETVMRSTVEDKVTQAQRHGHAD